MAISAGTAGDFCRALVDEAVASELSMVRHPFVGAVADGRATVEQLREFGTGMYRLVLDAQRWTAAGYSQVEDQAVRARLLGSMYEEETGALTGTAAHADLVADFVAALGQPRDETRRRARTLPPHFQAFCDFQEFLGRCRPFWLYRGVTSLAGEAQFTALCRLMVDVLARHYGMADDGLRFWAVHIPVDEEHTSTAVSVVGPYLEEPSARDDLRRYMWTHMEMRYRAWLEPLGPVVSVVSADASPGPVASSPGSGR
jgi:pyrroloquinoline quinone (PQQ) biosynthesis protein C